MHCNDQLSMCFSKNRHKQFFINILILCLFCAVSLSAQAFTLVLDPGHGGHDPGAIGKSCKEKNINLKVALRVGELVNQNFPNIRVIYTRKTDVFIPLDTRSSIANKAKADLFISIHANAIKGKKPICGAETYSLGMARASENLEVAKRENSVILYEKDNKERYAGFNPNSSESYIIFDFIQDQYMKQSAELAKSIQQQYVSIAHRVNRGVHQAGFLVLRETSMPSVLTELGYITTASEESFLNSANGIDAMARSIFQGFANYYRSHQRGGGAPAAKKSVEEISAPKVKEEVAPQQETATKQELSANDQKEQVQQAVKEEQPVIEEKLIDEVQNYNKTDNTKQEVKVEETKQDIDKNETVIYKIQIYTSDRKLKETDSYFKGLSPIDYFVENKIYKYTYGASASLKEIVALRRTIINKFPDCFVIAFRGNEKISLQEAQQNK